jgi:hypothetical protein
VAGALPDEHCCTTTCIRIQALSSSQYSFFLDFIATPPINRRVSHKRIHDNEKTLFTLLTTNILVSTPFAAGFSKSAIADARAEAEQSNAKNTIPSHCHNGRFFYIKINKSFKIWSG